MSRWAGPLAVVAVLVLVLWFASLNGDQRITLDLGFVRLYRFPVVLVAFGGLFLGMCVMLVAGIHADLRVRKLLRERLIEESREEADFVDRAQRDLFLPDPPRQGGPPEPPGAPTG